MGIEMTAPISEDRPPLDPFLKFDSRDLLYDRWARRTDQGFTRVHQGSHSVALKYLVMRKVTVSYMTALCKRQPDIVDRFAHYDTP